MSQRVPVRRYLYSLGFILHLFILVAAFSSTTCNLYIALIARKTDLPDGTPANHTWTAVLPDQKSQLAEDLAAACVGVVPCISVHVFGQKRAQAFKVLLETLEASDYAGYGEPLPLVIHLDGPSTDDDRIKAMAVREAATKFQWTHGPKILDLHERRRGLKASWLQAWPSPRADDIMLAFEDDVLPSPMYFQWLLKVLTEYRLLESEGRDPSLLGISLSPMRVDEITHPFRPWLTHEKVPHEYPIFLHAVPSSWGAAFFGRPWREFLAFASVRAAPPFYTVDEAALNLTGYGWESKRGDPNLWLPNSRSNNWMQSWKRYMVDFAYGRGAYMLYPNLPNSIGLATSTFMEGEHVPSGSYTNPRRAPLAGANELDLQVPLPSYDSLPVFDMHGEHTTRQDLARRADRFLGRISRLGRHYSTVLRHWWRPCLLNKAGPEPADADTHPRRHKHGAPARTYLVIAPQMGFSNQLIAVMYSAVWAHVLGRTLVLPHVLWPRASERHVDTRSWVPFHEVFDPTGVLELLPGLDFVYGDVAMMKAWQPDRLVDVEPQPLFDTLHDAYMQALGWGAIPHADVVPYRSMLGTSDSVYQHLGSCHDEVLLVNGLYKNPQLDEIPEPRRRQLWASLFRPTPLVHHMVEGFRRAIAAEQPAGSASGPPAYGCLHVRMGDFSTVCSAPPDTAPWLSTLYRIGRRCRVSLGEIVERANILHVDHLLIISDDALDLGAIIDGAHASKIWTSSDVRSFVQRELPPLRPKPTNELLEVIVAVTEQHVCAQADRVVLNAFSTFSRAISFYRGTGEGVEYW